MLDASTNSLPDWLRRRAFSNPDRLAIICGDTQRTFSELDADVDQAARWLASHEVVPGSRVAVHLPNSIAFVQLVHAISRLGAMLIPINLRLTADEIGWQLGDVRADLLITGDLTAQLSDARDRLAPDTRAIVIDPHSPDFMGGTGASPVFVESHSPDEVHSIVYTSGTTGRPKGALLTYGNHWWSAIGSGLNLGTHVDDRWIAVLPLFHVGGLSILQRSVIYGITAVVHESFDPGRVNQSIDEDRVTVISVVSTMLRRMLAERGDAPYPAWLRCVLLGGGPAPEPLLRACESRNIPVTQTYGLTETASQLATLPPDEALLKLGSAGKPLYPNELEIEVDGQLAARGVPGEIIVRGPIVTAGYFERPDETARAFDGGWFHTGDAGYLDDAGYLYVLDRRDDLIVSGGENVYPAEVEAVLMSHDDVAEAGVIGIPDDEWGQRVVAIVTPRDGCRPDISQLSEWCRRHIAAYKIPVDFTVQQDPLPRNAGGKLLRRELRRTWALYPR
ncbi:MAG: o-succinylbenzoate--CoA ligase [Sphaerobacteraceae bacterium]|nr:MAG: o-succinylbenzoate--CoA ligase [Sphaerobacteraceae bacterium]